MARLFGFSIEDNEPLSPGVVSPVPPNKEDGVDHYLSSGFFGSYVDIEGVYRTEYDLIRRYREMSLHPECDAAIEDVVNEALVSDLYDSPIEIELSNLNASDKLKEKIREEFKYIKEIMDFDKKCHEIFRNWYVDGRLYYHMVIDEKNPRSGLKEVRYIDPRKIRKVRENKRTDNRPGTADVTQRFHEYFIYSDKGFARDGSQGIKIAVDSVCYTNSGITDKDGKVIVSHLHKAIKPLNQLRMLEDATVIYRISRAPERRIFYIDVGNLPKMKAEQYLREIMQKYKNKLVYDANTGEIRDDRRYQTMLEDFWLPRREGGKGTEITTLQGGQNLGEIEDVLYFQKKMFKSLNVPVSRLESDSGFSLGRASEITRDELKFGKFIARLRLRFSHLFDKMLETQLLLKGVCTRKEWEQMREEISYDFQSDAHFTELKNVEIMKERLGILSDIDNYVGKYFSIGYVRKNILQQSEDDIKEIDEQMEEEAAEAEDDPVEEPIPPPSPPPQQLVVSVKKEETETRIIDDADQRELAKSMTAFFGTLVEEAKVDKEGN